MRVLVLGGAGLQGKTAIYDLSRSPEVEHIVCADMNPEAIKPYLPLLDAAKVSLAAVDASDPAALEALMKGEGEVVAGGGADGCGSGGGASGPFDVVIDVLPVRFLPNVCVAALEAGANVVNTMYGHQVPKWFHDRAVARGIAFLPEAGLDPGIDLVLCRYGCSQLDEVHELHSLCGGIPEPAAIDNPLKYKISWTWDGVLLSYKRPAVMMRDGQVITVDPKDQHAPEWVAHIIIPGVGKLESILNGDAMVFADQLGVAGTIRNTTRCTLRWPGHSYLWKTFYDLGFLSDEPVEGLGGGAAAAGAVGPAGARGAGGVTPHEFMVHHLGPRLQYGPGERDMVVMRIIVGGLKDGKRLRLTFDLVDRRDLTTGFMAMNRTVGFTVSICAQMMARGEIKGRGLLHAVRDIPARRFLDELRKRGIFINETREMGETTGRT